MADGNKVYKRILGEVCFDQEEREYNGGTLRSVLVAPVTAKADDLRVRITIWPNFLLDTPLKQGDWVAARGEFTTREVDGKVYKNLSATTLVVFPQVPKEETEVVNNGGGSSSRGDAGDDW